MTTIRLFDAHAHLQNYPGAAELSDARARAASAGVRLSLCAGTGPGDWEKVSLLASGERGLLPCFGLHPWFVEKAGEGWLPLLEKFLRGAPSCVGEIGLDKASDAALSLQETVFRAQLRLAVKLARPVVIHCVRAWGVMTGILKEERPSAFALHAYGGPPEMTAELARLGGYFSFGGDLMKPARAKMRKSLLAAPRERLLFETEAPSSAGLTDVLNAAAGILNMDPGALGELSWDNARNFLGGISPKL